MKTLFASPRRLGLADRVLPILNGEIDRRILVNYRGEPDVAARLLPAPLRPQLVNGWAIMGICLIRLTQVRPRGLPAWTGLSSENAAHRIAVEWDDDGQPGSGVFIFRRDTDSLLNSLAGGRVFPGVHHRADIATWEGDTRFKIAVHSRDDDTHIRLIARTEDGGLAGSVFRNLETASDFFACGSIGWSQSSSGKLEGMQLRTTKWKVSPLQVERVESSFFSDTRRFPVGSVEFDCALLMKNIPHEWHRCAWPTTIIPPRPEGYL